MIKKNMSKIKENFHSIFVDIKELLSVAVKDRNHLFHTPIFSNNSKKNSVESRVVVIRSFDPKNLILNFHTDLRSPKIECIRSNNLSSLLFYDPKIRTQLRIKTISTINNNNEIAKDAWKSTQLSSRKCYLTKKPPSTNTSRAEDGIPKHLTGVNPSIEESENGYKNFAVIQNKILNIDWLHLASSGHRRLSITFKNKDPIFNWLIP